MTAGDWPGDRQIAYEKTLELNLCAEILACVRRVFPNAYFRGMWQTEEEWNGIDEVLRAAGHNLIALQFKRPVHRALAGGYRFVIEQPQHDALLFLSRQQPRLSVLYVLPELPSLGDIEHAVPYLLRHARVAPAADLQNLAFSRDRAAVNLVGSELRFDDADLNVGCLKADGVFCEQGFHPYETLDPALFREACAELQADHRQRRQDELDREHAEFLSTLEGEQALQRYERKRKKDPALPENLLPPQARYVPLTGLADLSLILVPRS